MEVDNMAKDKPLEEFLQFNDGSGKALNCQKNCLYGSGKAIVTNFCNCNIVTDFCRYKTKRKGNGNL